MKSTITTKIIDVGKKKDSFMNWHYDVGDSTFYG